jgi:UDP-3-O-[3-hydroxymyristoyl] glucosamine N-acyltransferase|tara:strand:+ start:528 stop:1460 length:933 start_codon:yes stop_codon:yes gene_type:complete
MYRLKKNHVSIKEIANFLDYNYLNEDFFVEQVSTIDNIKNSSVVFFTNIINPKFNLKDNQTYNLKELEKFKDILLITDQDTLDISVPTIISKNPRLDFQRLIMNFFSKDEFTSGIHKTAVIESNVKLGKDVYVGPNCYIGNDVSIGDNSKILSNVSIFGICEIGKNCVISSNSTIGSEGFSFTFDNDHFIHFNHLGKISIGNNVWIGSNCTIERAQIDKTLIEDHVKIDDLVHISHNTTIKKFSQITVGSMILGRAIVGEHCWISPNCVIENGYEIGDNSIVGTSSLVRNNFPSNSVIIGTPAKLVRTNK